MKKFKKLLRRLLCIIWIHWKKKEVLIRQQNKYVYSSIVIRQCSCCRKIISKPYFNL